MGVLMLIVTLIVSGMSFTPTEAPILLPLTSSLAFKLTSVKDGVFFDLDADGAPEQTAWTAADSKLAFLAIDRDGDGAITSGRELFGNNTVAGAHHGFEALRVIMPAGQDDGVIDSADPLYAKLLLWEDANHNGVSEANELQPFSNLYAAVGLGAGVHMRRDGNGNLLRYRGFAFVRTAPGRNKTKDGNEGHARQRDIYDVIFVR